MFQTFDFVSATLIEEERTRASERRERNTSKKSFKHRNDISHRNKQNIASSAKNISDAKCDFCGRKYYVKEPCFLNPKNPKNRLPESLKKIYREQKKTSTKPKDKNKGTIAGVAITRVYENIHTAATASHEIEHDNRACIVDSGASAHMFGSKALFRHMCEEKSNNSIDTADGNSTPIEGVGTVVLSISESFELSLGREFFAPNLQFNLVSASALARNGISILFEGQQCTLSKNGETIGIVHKSSKNDLYVISISFNNSNFSLIGSLQLWHLRAGHIRTQRLLLEVHKHVNDLPKLTDEAPVVCEPCKKAKGCLIPYKGKMERVERAGEIIYSDVASPFQRGRESKRFFITFIDDFSRHLWVITTESKRVMDYFSCIFEGG